MGSAGSTDKMDLIYESCGPEVTFMLLSLAGPVLAAPAGDTKSVFWISGSWIQGLKKRSKMLNNHKIILLFTTSYLSFDIF